ncbi:hypothetical protein [Nocardioides ferulae]|uniref:hypothetical protein n=1 Tax=Nocardioides ferulae TaxID=2340821 RepID=UPI000EAD533C|nr:hypothetical protein [Nocardioides ferulae]
MAKTRIWLALGLLLMLLGVVVFLLQPGPPDGECVPEGAPSSGWVISDCPMSEESYAEIRDYETSPKPFRIAGLILVVTGLAALVVGFVTGRRSSPDAPPTPPGTA